MSEPQLRKDINELQAKLRESRARIAELEAMPARVITKEVQVPTPGPTVVKRVEVPVPTPGPVQIQVVEREVIKYVKCPKQAAIIKKLRARK